MVIVILGILAAVAVPRFANLTDQANQAVAKGVVGALMSTAVLQLGANQGQPVTFASVVANTDLENFDVAPTVTTDLGGTCNTTPGTTAEIQVTVGGQLATGDISTALCSG